MAHRHLHLAGIITACTLLGAAPALADKPSWAGGGHEKKARQGDDRHERQRGGDGAARFDSDARTIIGAYYGEQARAGKCPPGLAKKNNGCLPPGQAKKWSRGQPLPGDLRYGSLPPDLLRRLPPPPPQHRYVQVAGDILMIAIGTNMVIDAVEDILR